MSTDEAVLHPGVQQTREYEVVFMMVSINNYLWLRVLGLQVLYCNEERESSLLTTYWSRSTDVFGVPASRHGSLNPLFQVALYLPS